MMTRLEIPTFYGLAGYGCDGELEMDDLERNVGKAMKAGAFLGAYGLTQRDVKDMFRICNEFLTRSRSGRQWRPRASLELTA